MDINNNNNNNYYYNNTVGKTIIVMTSKLYVNNYALHSTFVA